MPNTLRVGSHHIVWSVCAKALPPAETRACAMCPLPCTNALRQSLDAGTKLYMSSHALRRALTWV